MASPNHTLPSPDISDVMNLLCTMKKQNDEILTKLNSIEDDNRKLRQELLEIKSSLKLNNNNFKVSSRKRDEPEDEDEAEHENEQSSNKKARVSVSVASLPPEPEPEPQHGHVVESPASFNTLDDDCLGNVLDFVGKKSYSVFGRVNKRCHEIFCSKGLPKETYLYGYGPLHIIQQQQHDRWDYNKKISKGVLHYNRRDFFERMLTDESHYDYYSLKQLCYDSIKETRLDILREVFQRANGQQLKYLRNCDNEFDLCWIAAHCGKLECMKLLRENECRWNENTWIWAKRNGHEHILQYLRDNGYPSEWQNQREHFNE